MSKQIGFQEHSKSGRPSAVDGVTVGQNPNGSSPCIGKESSPIIVIGSGRSGTALVSRTMQALGIEMGFRQDENGEALLFIRRNIWLMSRAGVNWHNPRNLAVALDDPDFMAEAVKGFRLGTKRPRTLSYLGWGAVLRNHSIEDQSSQWGWKDPRNTFTLPAWLEVFPDAKVIHVMRHGVDVAHSYWNIQQTRPGRARFIARAMARRRYHLPTVVRELKTWRSVDEGAGQMRRFGSIEVPMDLWSTYTDHAAEQLAALPADRSLLVRFEELVSNPFEEIRRIAAFCGHNPDLPHLSALAATVDPSRRFAYRADPRLCEVAAGFSDELAQHGYSPEGRLRPDKGTNPGGVQPDVDSV